MHPQGLTEWASLISGLSLAGAALAALALALFQDRPRSRRRCPRCWYDLAALARTPFASLTCPECGRTIGKPRQLLRTRRRWGRAALSLLLLISAVALSVWPWSRAGAWHRWAPSIALVVALPWIDDDWPVDELQQRLWTGPDGADASYFVLKSADGLWPWQWRLLAKTVPPLATSDAPSLRRRKAMSLIFVNSPCPGESMPLLLKCLSDPDAKVRFYAAWAIKGNRFAWSSADRAACIEALQRVRAKGLPLLYPNEEDPIDLALKAFDLEPGSPEAANAPLTPDSIERLLRGAKVATLAPVFTRLGIDARTFTWPYNGESGPFQVHPYDLEIDGRPGTDRVLLIGDEGGTHWEALVFVATGDTFCFTGRLDLSNNFSRMPQFRSQIGPGGRAWLVVCMGGGASQSGFAHVFYSDSWIDAGHGRLRALLRVPVEGSRYSTAVPPAACPVNTILIRAEPRMTEHGGRVAIEYDHHALFRAGWNTAWNGEPAAGLAAEAGELFERRETARFIEQHNGTFAPDPSASPWSSEEALYKALSGDPAEFLAANHPQLLDLARAGTSAQRAWLRLFLTLCPDSTARAEFQAILEHSN